MSVKWQKETKTHKTEFKKKEQFTVFVFTLKGLSPLWVNMCLWSQLWLVDGVLYTLQPFHRQTNTWRADRDEDRSRSWGEHSEQTREEKKQGEKWGRENMEDNVGWQREITQQPRQKDNESFSNYTSWEVRTENPFSRLLNIAYRWRSSVISATVAGALLFCHCGIIHRMHFLRQKAVPATAGCSIRE